MTVDESGSAQVRQKQEEFARRVAAAREAGSPEPTEEEIVEAVKATREEIYRERYGCASPKARTKRRKHANRQEAAKPARAATPIRPRPIRR